MTLLEKITTLVFLSISVAYADEPMTTEMAEEHFKATFQNTAVSSFKESIISGLYEMNVGGRIVYFHAEEEVLFMGQILSKDGRNLTAEAEAISASETAKHIPLDLAVSIGPEDGVPIIEFSDPDCPYCLKYHSFIQDIERPVRRYIFFETRIHPEARAKVIHILCSEDQEAAYNDIYGNKAPAELIRCEQGDKLADAHLDISKSAGVNATPSFFLGGAFERGFRREALAQYIEGYELAISE